MAGRSQALEPELARSSAVSRLKRLGLTVAMGVAALNIWTGAPLVALWIGSQAQGSGPPTMTSVFVVVVAFAALAFGLIAVLGRLGRAHDRLAGHAPTVDAHVPWLRSMRGERASYDGDPARLSGLERVLVAMVVVVVLVFEIWFLFYSTSPIDNRTGRAAAPAADGAVACCALPARAVRRASPLRDVWPSA